MAPISRGVTIDTAMCFETVPGADTALIAAFNGATAGQLIMLVVAIVGLTLVMLSTRRRFRESRALTQRGVRSRYESLGRPVPPPGDRAAGATPSFTGHRQTLHDIERVMLELDQLSRQVHGRLDTRFAKLEALIRDADERIAKLSKLTGSSVNRAAEQQPGATQQSPPTPVAPPGNADQRGANRSVAGDETPQRTTGDVRHRRVYELADGGATPAAIARTVSKTTGEIELILNLRSAARGRPASSDKVSSGSTTPA